MRRRGAARPNSKQCVRARERDAQVLVLLRDGKTYEEIAGIVGFADRSGAYLSAMRALRNIPAEGVEEYRKLQKARLERLWTKLQPGVEEGDPIAIRTAVHVVEKICRLMGIPMGDVTVTNAGSETTINILVTDGDASRVMQRLTTRTAAPAITAQPSSDDDSTS